jgi:hypothetical protein
MSKFPWTDSLAEASAKLGCTITTHIVDSEGGYRYCAAIENSDGTWRRECGPMPRKEYVAWAHGYLSGLEAARERTA